MECNHYHPDFLSHESSQGIYCISCKVQITKVIKPINNGYKGTMQLQKGQNHLLETLERYCWYYKIVTYEKGEEMKNNSEITNENFRQIGNKLVESLLYPDATKIELFSYLKEKTMNNQDIRDLILDLEETIQECKRIVKKSSYGNEIIKLEGEISAYKDCIVRLQEYYK